MCGNLIMKQEEGSTNELGEDLEVKFQCNQLKVVEAFLFFISSKYTSSAAQIFLQGDERPLSGGVVN